MGQALRRASARRLQDVEPLKTVEHRPSPPPPPPPVAPSRAGQDHVSVADPESIEKMTNELNVLEERDPGYDAMLNKMLGRITSKPGGKQEMGEAFIVEKYNRPLPKVRSSKSEARSDEKNSIPSGTLTAAQLQEIILLHQGKSEQHQGPMGVDGIAQKFRIDVSTVERIVKFLSMPPEHHTKTTQQ